MQGAAFACSLSDRPISGGQQALPPKVGILPFLTQHIAHPMLEIGVIRGIGKITILFSDRGQHRFQSRQSLAQNATNIVLPGFTLGSRVEMAVVGANDRFHFLNLLRYAISL